jgi:hypothetical protein
VRIALAIAALFSFAGDKLAALATAAPADAGLVAEGPRPNRTTSPPTPTPEVVVGHIADLVAWKLGAKDYADLLRRVSPSGRKEYAASTASTLASLRNFEAVSPSSYLHYASCVMAAKTYDAQQACGKAAQEASFRKLKEAGPSLYRDYESCLRAAQTRETQVDCDKVLHEATIRNLRAVAPSVSGDYELCLKGAQTREAQVECARKAQEAAVRLNPSLASP